MDRRPANILIVWKHRVILSLMCGLAMIGKEFELTISAGDIFDSKLREAQFDCGGI